ncbi:MAG TPA: ATP-binding protein [Polyangiaceae bacterium]
MSARVQGGLADSTAELHEALGALEAELADSRLLHELSAAFVDEQDLSVFHQKLVDAAARVMRSDAASMQSFHPERGASGELRLLAHRGFDAEAAAYWEWVRPDSRCACGQALRDRDRTVVPDVEAPGVEVGVGDLAAFRRLGIRSMQTTPLRSRGGALVGMLSTHWSRPHVPSERDLRNFDILARQAADLIERSKAMEALRARTAQLIAADRHKDEFLATLAHELRNPLAPIRTGLALLHARKADAFDRVVPMMERQLGHMVRLIDDLLDVSRVSQGKVTLRKERVPLRSVVDSAIETSRPLLEAGRHRFGVSISGPTLWLDADATRLAQVISNVLNNAAKYTPDGGRIRLVAERMGEDAIITVTDDGVGIAPEMLPRVFDLFAQLEPSLERAHGGLGIGLSLAKMLVEMHGGSIRAQSDGPGLGSAFVIRLPLAVGSNVAVSPANGHVASPVAARHRVLVVDDNVDGAEMLAMLLEETGHATKVVCESPKAVAAALAFRPDVVFLDLGMPELDGFELARRLRQEPELERTVLVALTGFGGDDDRRRSRQAGVDRHLTKPVLPSALAELLAELPASE